MKKVFFTILSLFILSCSSDDDNNNNDNSSEPTVNSDLVGTWVGSVTDAIVLTGESNVSELTWYSNATTIFGTLEGQLDEIGYVLSEQNQQLDLTFPEGDVGIYVRLE